MTCSKLDDSTCTQTLFSGESESEEGMIIAGLYAPILLNMALGRVM